MKKRKPTQEWLRIAAEARPHQPPAPADEPAPAWFVTRALAERRVVRTRGANTPGWFALPGLARAATACTVLAAACAVFVLSTGSLDDFIHPIPPELEMDLDFESIDLP